MRLPDGARVAVIGAGPSGLVAAKHALEAGFDDRVRGERRPRRPVAHDRAPHSGVWPGMRTNTSRAMTAFSDFPAPADAPAAPRRRADPRLSARLRARTSACADRIRFGTPRRATCRRAGRSTASAFDAVVVASGRFRRPRLPPGLDALRRRAAARLRLPGRRAVPRPPRARLRQRHQRARDRLRPRARDAPVVSAFRKPRYVIQKVVDGVSSDWQWYTAFGALERRAARRARS